VEPQLKEIRGMYTVITKLASHVRYCIYGASALLEVAKAGHYIIYIRRGLSKDVSFHLNIK
jgi:hypothetical protein